MPFFRGDVGSDAYVLECAVSAIAVEDVCDRREISGRAIRRLFHAAGFAFLDAPIQISSDEEIEQTVVIVIEKSSRGGPAARGDSGFGANVRKSAVTIIVVENIFSEVGHVYVGESVVVVIAHRNAHSVVRITSVGQAGPYGDVGEAAILILAIEPVPVSGILAIEADGAAWRLLQVPGIHQKNIEQSVVVVIQQRHASRHGLDEIFSGRGRIAENEIESL